MKIIELQSVGSTNDYAKGFAKQGASSGTVIWAREQTAGRGRQGNEWISAPGNLFMSMILKPKVDVEHIGQLSFLFAVSLASVLETVIPASAEIHLKWPNDLLINQKKAAGILIETESQATWVVVGIGLNITNAPEGAISLQEIGVNAHNAESILQLLAKEMQKRIEHWEKNGFQTIRAAWLKRAYKLGREIRARFPKETLTGVFEGIDMTGALQLKMSDGTVRLMNSGEVFI
ncbi:MAG: biotin--[acetyl-CoA-carboxylase] ligase [Proteobacteria bacterium]|nr:biotin--[acetyl-CoA-carboxylase] ligase [Pseudomonadota bacterium]